MAPSQITDHYYAMLGVTQTANENLIKLQTPVCVREALSISLAGA